MEQNHEKNNPQRYPRPELRFCSGRLHDLDRVAAIRVWRKGHVWNQRYFLWYGCAAIGQKADAGRPYGLTRRGARPLYNP